MDDDGAKIARARGRGGPWARGHMVGPGVIVEARGPGTGAGSPTPPPHALEAKFTQCQLDQLVYSTT